MNEVHFIEVGRDKKSWVSRMKVISYSRLVKEIRKHSALMSSDVNFDLNSGSIFAGFRSVGRIKIREAQESFSDGDPQEYEDN